VAIMIWWILGCPTYLALGFFLLKVFFKTLGDVERGMCSVIVLTWPVVIVIVFLMYVHEKLMWFDDLLRKWVS
jgi:hypothetical protein